ncbi:bifunctional diaminohydroxyphosphoribosylaminopyrimidine deaminase/5-amino-6-(5-phosphoribosylamino)uracil reductase RibD [Desulforhopalus singaporensis]|uniref:Riboflavin biosynthesis protein RibD n=1 Tax=Desulforhopalus singaporensis TaxID=91360 RepID=A0A1H0MNA1_9BACT|nr:bifunctional diaminohydroxyphosphoribosylaminopyrimidine deaminase/5-amino-6-(5-phosphoribosylamino)uracil reductase RibD [Desulforhopalus singaporensis]SDO81756.1 diaminohydroxyphosphoribosylaminopyrimidine deaminase [Desulforhopalus singaporensis]
MKTANDEHYMQMAVQEARKGQGRTSPNPCVGAVIVKNGKLVSKGYHKKAGTPHAEINAITASGSVDLAGATIYVTLEPCSHTGRTPPCCEALVSAGFSRVVVGMTDPNPRVNGRGISFLRRHGIAVDTGLLEKRCVELNYPFIKHVTQGTPWMIMKAGVSLDGRLNYQAGKSGWITGEESKKEVHRLRDVVDGIMVGSATAIIDNPSLTTRLNDKKGKDPVRIILDSHLAVPLSSTIFNQESSAPVWLVCGKNVSNEKTARFRDKNIEIIQVDGDENGLDLRQVLTVLGKRDICSVLVEGGARLHGAFLRKRLYDYAHLFYAPLFAGDRGVPLVSSFEVKDRESAPRLEHPQMKRLGEDFMVSGKILYP